ncbi:hypothetical protein BJ508DRAFT_416694 [Ascobolus immersus RN42]|uniref:Uncharacterized protein n=1 Tax=Ascobolus immersus RN42 TaxID=1160509 RepID=A0A3N4HY81_ASCIM|nr:hypothetical protein BJ508DRAFT_416694 [Ascobolus immersus RN42]
MQQVLFDLFFASSSLANKLASAHYHRLSHLRRGNVRQELHIPLARFPSWETGNGSDRDKLKWFTFIICQGDEVHVTFTGLKRRYEYNGLKSCSVCDTYIRDTIRECLSLPKAIGQTGQLNSYLPQADLAVGIMFSSYGAHSREKFDGIRQDFMDLTQMFRPEKLWLLYRVLHRILHILQTDITDTVDRIGCKDGINTNTDLQNALRFIRTTIRREFSVLRFLWYLRAPSVEERLIQYCPSAQAIWGKQALLEEDGAGASKEGDKGDAGEKHEVLSEEDMQENA